MHIVVDELNDGSSGELLFILMQIQNKMFCDIGGHLGKLVSSASL